MAAAVPRPGDDAVRVVDLGGGRRPRGRAAPGYLPSARRLAGLSRRHAVRAIRFVQALARARWFALSASFLFLTAVGAWARGFAAVALGLALLGFGLSTTVLLFSRLQALRTLSSRLAPGVRWAVAAAAAGVLSLTGLSSGAVLGLVLFIGGFATVGALWNLLSRFLLPMAPPGAVGKAHPDPLPVVASGGSVVLLFILLGLPLLLVPHRLGTWGAVLAGAEGGLVLGLLPTDVGLLREVRRPTKALWFAFHARRVFRDCFFAAGVLALLGRALSVLVAGGETGPLGVVLIVASYLYALVRRVPALAPLGPRPHPLVLPSFTFLLLFTPLIVVLSEAPALPLVYGGAEVLGLASGLGLVLLRQLGGGRALPAGLERLAATYGLMGRGRQRARLPEGVRSGPGIEVISLDPNDQGREH